MPSNHRFLPWIALFLFVTPTVFRGSPAPLDHIDLAATPGVAGEVIQVVRDGTAQDIWHRYREAMVSGAGPANVPAAPGPREYTWDRDFDEGLMVGVNHDAPNNHQLQLNKAPSTFPFIWIALAGRDTIVKIDTSTGDVLGEYWSRPSGRKGNPSRTTVDLDGNVWVGNRDEVGPGSIVRLGLLEAGGCRDRNGNGRIETSSGLGDVLDWTNAGGADSAGGVSTAKDECVINYVRVPPSAVRTIAVNAQNDVWVGGVQDHLHVKVDGRTAQIVAQVNASCGGYGGLIDGNGVLWSATKSAMLLYLDTLHEPFRPRCLENLSHQSYGLGINTEGYVWMSDFKDSVIRFSPDGRLTGEFSTRGAANDRGVAVTPADNNVWVANSGGNTVSRLAANGRYVALVTVGRTPTGLAVDHAGKVWSTNMDSNTASRIDPETNKVDLTVSLGSGASPYNYSDMTGMVARSVTTHRGTWLVVHDSGEAATSWKTITWTSMEPTGTSVAVRVRSAEAVSGLGGATWQPAVNGEPIVATTGRFLQVETALTTDRFGATPILYDLTVSPTNPPFPSPIVTPTQAATSTPTQAATSTPTQAATSTPTQAATSTPTQAATSTSTPPRTDTPTPIDTQVPRATVPPGPAYLPLALREKCQPGAQHADVVLVIDASTSMRDEFSSAGRRKLDAAREAATLFIQQLDLTGGDQGAIVQFNDDAKLLVPLTRNRALLAEGLASIQVNRQTRMQLGIRLARAELSGRHHRALNTRTLILLTDGANNPEPVAEAEREAELARGDGVRVFTVALGTEVEREALIRMASSTADYFHAPDGEDLIRIYSRIAYAIPCRAEQFWGLR